MIRSSRSVVAPRRILIATAVALVPLIAGCEAGDNAPVLHWHQPTNGTFQAVNTNITISNAFVLGAPANPLTYQTILPRFLGEAQTAAVRHLSRGLQQEETVFRTFQVEASTRTFPHDAVKILVRLVAEQRQTETALSLEGAMA